MLLACNLLYSLITLHSDAVGTISQNPSKISQMKTLETITPFSHQLSIDDHYKVETCNDDQLNRIRLTLEGTKGVVGVRLDNFRCPSTNWLSNYFKEVFHSDSAARKSFLGINVGCNGAFDTIDMARMGTGNEKFDKAVWRHAIGANPNSGESGKQLIQMLRFKKVM